MKQYLQLLIALMLLLPAASATPDTASVGAYVLNVGKYDVSSGSYTIDFYLSITCPKKCDPQFEFANGRATSTDKLIDRANEKFYRIQAQLQEQVDLRSFPFDEQQLTILLEDKTRTSQELHLEVDEASTGLDPSVKFVGWEIKNFKSQITQHTYSVYDEVFDQYQFTITIKRIPLNAVLKTLLPVFFIVVVTMFSFLIDPDKVTQRLTMTGSSLVAAVMFHVNISNQLPPVSYLTFADRFMILTYTLLLFSLGISVLLLELGERKKTALAEKIHRATEFSMLGLVPLVYALLFIFGF